MTFAKTAIASQENFIFKQVNINNTYLPLIYIKKHGEDILPYFIQ